MALYSNRKKQRELAEYEANGISLWSPYFCQEFRFKLVAYIDMQLDSANLICSHACTLLALDTGKDHRFLVPCRETVFDLLRRGSDDDVADVIEAVFRGIIETCDSRDSIEVRYTQTARKNYESYVKKLLAEHRISFDLVNGQMVEKKSQELHTEVVEPALTLLAGRPEFRDVERAYQDALGELSDQKPADALTDAGTALQAMLTQLGCPGKTLGEQIKEAKGKGLFAGRDTPLLGSITGLLQWVAGERNQRSDAHNVVDVPLSEGWLMVHVVGAIIVMLAQKHEEN